MRFSHWDGDRHRGPILGEALRRPPGYVTNRADVGLLGPSTAIVIDVTHRRQATAVRR